MRFLVAAIVFLGFSSPSRGQQPPAELSVILSAAEEGIAKRSAEKLGEVTVGDPKTVFAWRLRPAAMMEIVKRNWKVLPIQPPDTDTWYAVFTAPQPCESQGDHVHTIVRDGPKWRIGSEIPETTTFGFRLLDHEIKASFDVAKHSGTFTDDVTGTASTGAYSTMQLRIASDYQISKLTADGVSLKYRQAGGVVYAERPASTQFKLHLEYGGVSNHPDIFVGNFIDPTEICLASYWYPTIARLPTKHSVSITVPKGWKAIGQGDFLNKSDADSSTTYAYRMTVPTVYFTLDAAPYHEYARTVNGRLYRVWTVKPRPEAGPKQVEMMDSSFRLFEKLWGPYPWNQYTIVETAQPGWMGALEAYSFTTYATGLIPGDNPHEWGHTWWGGITPCTYLKDIFNESLATYSESVFYRYGKGDATNRSAYEKLFRSRAFPGLEGVALALDKTADALNGASSMVGYQKGGLVFQALEDLVGFEALQKSLLNLRKKFEGSYEAATYADVETMVASTTGTDVKWFFDQWVRRSGLPSLKVGETKVVRSAPGYKVSVELIQNGEPYHLKVPVWIETEDRKYVVDEVEITGASKHVEITTAVKPVRVLLDPEVRLPRVTTGTPGRRVAPEDAIVIYGPSDETLAKKIAGARKLLPDSAATDEVIHDKDLIFVGSPQTNKAWKRFVACAPFRAGKDYIESRGKRHPGASATAITANPLSPEKTARWISGKLQTENRTGFGAEMNPTRLLLIAASGDLIDGELLFPTTGPTVKMLTVKP